MDYKVIRDASGKARKVKNIRNVIHEIPNDLGEIDYIKYVEYIVIGNSREWVDYCRLDIFELLNPDIK